MLLDCWLTSFTITTTVRQGFSALGYFPSPLLTFEILFSLRSRIFSMAPVTPTNSDFGWNPMECGSYRLNDVKLLTFDHLVISHDSN